MSHRYSFGPSDPDEQEPLGISNSARFSDTRQRQTNQPVHREHLELEHQEPYYDNPVPTPLYQQQASQQHRQQPLQYPPSSSRPVRGPGFHPDSSYKRLSADRQQGRDRAASGGPSSSRTPAPSDSAPARTAPSGAIADGDIELVSPVSPPVPPHRGSGSQPPFTYDTRYDAAIKQPQSNITPGADNFSESAAGGMAGIAYSVADRNPRESGMEAMRGMPPQAPYRQYDLQDEPAPGYSQQAHRSSASYYPPPAQHNRGRHGLYDHPDQGQSSSQMLRPIYSAGSNQNIDRDSRSSLQGLGSAAYPPGSGTPGSRTPSRSPHSFAATDMYAEDPFQRHAMQQAELGYVNPNEIEDDGDDGLEYGRARPHRTSMLSMAGYSTKSNRSGPAIAGAAAAVGTTAAMALGGAAVSSHAHEMPSGTGGDGMATSGGARYNALDNRRSEYDSGSAGAGGGGGAYNYGRSGAPPEKSAWLAQQSHSKKTWRLAIIFTIALIIVAGIVCGILFGVVFKHKSTGSQESASDDTAKNGDLSLNSAEIQKLLNNKNLHKVFPGIDYTPINTQYPACLTNPPSQNNVTRDIAVLSQLTNTIRLYGTDCNQTEMTLHAIKQLEMNDTVKVWMGVWQDANTTTNARQLAQMWDILETYGGDPFKGVIVANEILFREQMTTSELATLLTSVRTNMTKMGLDLPVATSDLGTVWDAELAAASDYVMANIHPFFGGVNAKDAASWTWDFWESHNGPFFKSNSSHNVISETGWPSQGGTDCGTGSTETSCPDAAVAGISELNEFLAGWVCDALTNGTQYFWFEAFDEPWKIAFDSGDENWEDHWGVMDVNRNLKAGVTIPDCGGQTV